VSQREFECGSHQCGKNTSNGLRQFGNLSAVYLDNHGPNIVFHHDISPQEVIDFIEANFNLEGKTGGYMVEDRNKDYFRLTSDEIAIDIPALPRPTLAELQEYGICEIVRDDSPEEAVTLRLGLVLDPTEKHLPAHDTYWLRTMRLRSSGRLLGFQHWKWLLKNLDRIKAAANSKVRAAVEGCGFSIEFPGTVMRSYDCNRTSFPSLGFSGAQFQCWHDFSGCGTYSPGLIAVAGTALARSSCKIDSLKI
jgi:hypothetical protein